MNPVLAFDLLALSGLLVSMVLIVTVPSGRTSPVSNGAKTFILVAVALYALSMASRVTDHAGLGRLLEGFEDYADLLVAPLITCAAYSLFAQNMLLESDAQTRRLAETHRMLDTIVETTPAGIVTIDAAGRITWANERARALLELGDDARPSAEPTAWTAKVVGAAPELRSTGSELDVLAGPASLDSAPMTISWPDGRVLRLFVSTQRVQGEHDSAMEIVASFVERQVWLSKAAGGSARDEATEAGSPNA